MTRAGECYADGVGARAIALTALALGACSLAVPLDDLDDGGSVAASASSAVTGAGGGAPTTASSAASATSTSSASTGTGGEDLPWFDAEFDARRNITVENPSPDVEAIAHPVAVTLPLSLDEARRSRLLRWEGRWVDVAHVVEVLGSDVVLWFPLTQPLPPGGASTSHWLYSGSPDPQTEDQGAVFSFHDEFSVDVDPSVWATIGDVGVDTGEVVLDGAGAGLRSLAGYGPGFAVDFAMRVAIDGDYFWGGYQRLSDFDEIEPWVIWISREPGAQIWPEVTIDAADVSNAVGAPHPRDGEEHVYSVERFPERVVFRFDGALHDTLFWQDPYTEPMQLRFAVGAASTVPATTVIDWVRVRRAADPAMVTSVGAPEAGP